MQVLLRLLMVFSMTATLALSACDDKGPAEKAGEKIDQVVKDVGDTLEKAGDKIEEAADKATK